MMILPHPAIRMAVLSDHAKIASIIEEAYRPYVERIGREPAPMGANYVDLIERQSVWVLEAGAEVVGLIVVEPNADHLLIDNVAVRRSQLGHGFGRALLEYSEWFARERGLNELRLYTNELMHENLAIYTRLGWEELSRTAEDGFNRVYFRKRLS